MKKILIFFLCAGTIAGTAFLIGNQMEMKKQREAICRVFEDRRQARTESKTPARGWTTEQFNEDKYFKKLKEISTENCPVEFRQAWQEYIFARDRRLNYSTAAAAGDLLTLWDTAKPTGKGGANEVIQRAEKRDPGEAFRQVKKTALKFGIDATAEE